MNQKIDVENMTGWEFACLGQQIYGTAQIGRNAWKGRLARRLRITPTRVRQIVSAQDERVPTRLAQHLADIHELWKLGRIKDCD